MTFLSDRTVEHLREAVAWPDAGPRYTVGDVVGKGGAGTVYVARDHVVDRDVAIKVVDVADRAGRGADRLLSEARILAALDHPGIVPIHDRGVLPDGRAFYVMKLVRGRNLTEAATAEAALAGRLALFSRVLDAVAFAHAAGLALRARWAALRAVGLTALGGPRRFAARWDLDALGWI